MKNKIIAITIVSTMMMAMAGCGSTASQTTENAAPQASAETEITDESVPQTANTETYTIGISQFAEHGSLDNCREGFIEGLAEAGIVEGENLTVSYSNAQADTGTASTISDSFVSQKVDMICAIATPSAASAYNSCMNTDIPVIYTAVSDPIASGFAREDKSSVGNITGTSDALAVTAQLEMIRQIMPDAKKIGIIYTTSETNSASTVAEYEKYAADYGFEMVTTGINTIADVDLAASDIVGKVDCITNLTDNTVVSALQTVLNKATAAGIPVFGSEVEQVKAGCVASMGLEYFELGKQTGAMAAKVLRGEATAESMEYEVISEPSLYVNTTAADLVGITLDADYVASASESFDAIVVE